MTRCCARAQINKPLDYAVDFVLIAYVMLGQRAAIQLNANRQYPSTTREGEDVFIDIIVTDVDRLAAAPSRPAARRTE